MNIVLTGFMGTGKSVVGRILAEKLGWQFFDIDALIEKETGFKISDIFARKGESHFRDLETKTIKLVSLLDKAVISCGGGAVLKAENLDELEKKGVIVCLSASPEKILERTKKNSDRPLLKVEDPVKKINELLIQREPYYKRCSLMIDTSNINENEVAKKILKDKAISSKIQK